MTDKITFTEEERKEAMAQSFDMLMRMNYIISRIRLNDSGILPTSEKGFEEEKKVFGEGTSKEVSLVSKVEFPQEGGVLTHYTNLKYPVKGFSWGDTVDRVDNAKKVAVKFFNGIYYLLRKNKILGLIFILIFKRQLEDLAYQLICSVYANLREIRSKPERYCPAVRETYRVFNKILIWETGNIDENCASEKGELIYKSRDICCMALEYDDIYRYIFQFTMERFNRESAKKDIIKELSRLLDIVEENVNDEEIINLEWTLKGKWKVIKKMLFFVRFMPAIKNNLRKFFLELDIDKIKMDDGDKYHADFKKGFNWNG